MARIRYIKPEFFDSEQVASVTPTARLLFAGLWTIADREGRFEFSSRRLKAKLFPYDNLQVDPLLAELYGAVGKDGKRLVEFYRAEGALYGWMPSFTKHQRPHPNEAASVIPPPGTGTPAPPDSWNVTSARDGVIATPTTPDSCNVTSPHDASLQCRGEQNGEGNGEGERTDRAPLTAAPTPRTSAEILRHPPVPPRLRAGHGDPHGFRRDPNEAALIDLGGERVVSVPAGWATKACREYGLTDADIQAFAKWCAGYVQRHGFEDGGKRLAWLDARLADFRAERTKPNDGLRPASEWIADRAKRDAEIPEISAERRRELLRPARGGKA